MYLTAVFFAPLLTLNPPYYPNISYHVLSYPIVSYPVIANLICHAVAEPVSGWNRNRDRFLGFRTAPTPTVLKNRLTRTEPNRWFRPPDQPEPVGSGLPIEPNRTRTM